MITLRQRIDAQGPLPLHDAAHLVMHLARSVEEPLANGQAVYLLPGNIWLDEHGRSALGELHAPPTDARDLAAFPPELVSTLGSADRSAAVYQLGAVLYEALSGQTVGPNRAPIHQLRPDVPVGVEHLFQAALQPDRNSRPADLGALVAALAAVIETTPSPSTAPADLDIELSQAPPPVAGLDHDDPFAMAVRNDVPAPRRSDVTIELSQLKADLESDPRPRYVVHKEKMDHGPFSAVELLQQIANHTFVADHVLRDEVAGESKPIGEYVQFAPFAEHARMHRDIAAEKKAVVRLEQQEKQAGIAKYLMGTGAILVLATVAVLVVIKTRASNKAAADLSDDPAALDLKIEGGIQAQKRATGGGGGGGGGGRGFAGGMSYEAALNRGQELNMGGGGGADLSNAQLHGPMKSGGFVSACGAPNDMKVTVKVAVQNGRAVGVSVYTNPANGGVQSCIDRQVRGLGWPSSPKLDSFTTTY